jgi:hypothetical protein
MNPATPTAATSRHTAERDQEHVDQLAHRAQDRPGEFHRERGAHQYEHCRAEAAAAAAVGVCAVRD